MDFIKDELTQKDLWKYSSILQTIENVEGCLTGLLLPVELLLLIREYTPSYRYAVTPKFIDVILDREWKDVVNTEKSIGPAVKKALWLHDFFNSDKVFYLHNYIYSMRIQLYLVQKLLWFVADHVDWVILHPKFHRTVVEKVHEIADASKNIDKDCIFTPRVQRRLLRSLKASQVIPK